MDNKEAIMILKYVLGQNEERKNTKMFDKGITLYPSIHKEREALGMAIKALEAMSGMVEVKVLTSAQVAAEAKKIPDFQFGNF